jgi:hypothetical protein
VSKYFFYLKSKIMAWTLSTEIPLEDLDLLQGNEGDYPTYNSEDIAVLQKQRGFFAISPRNIRFRGELMTGLTAKDYNGQYLSVIALPCPPHCRPTNDAGVYIGNMLT